MPNRRTILKAALLSPFAAIATAQHSEAATAKVRIQSMQFLPNTLKIKAGTTITFENNDSMEHTATAKDESWDTGNLRAGKSAQITFNEKGTYAYYCRWHGGMRGKIVVS